MTEDIAAFIHARLKEDAEYAREASLGDSGRWFAGEKSNVYHVEDETPWDDYESNKIVVPGNCRAESEHIAHHDPARVLRGVEAKRQILRVHEHTPAPCTRGCPSETEELGFGCSNCHFDVDCGETMSWGWCQTICLIASEWSDHPDYREGWAS